MYNLCLDLIRKSYDTLESVYFDKNEYFEAIKNPEKIKEIKYLSSKDTIDKSTIEIF
jgi:hypothetical protein